MLTLPELAVLSFAAARGTQLLVHDSIGDPLRDPLFAWNANKPESKIRQFVITLISCVYCMGAHVSWVTLLAYLYADGRLGDTSLLGFGINWFAIAGAQMLLNRYDDSLSK